MEKHTNLMCDNQGQNMGSAPDVHHEKTDLKVFVVVIPKEGWVSVAAPILLLV